MNLYNQTFADQIAPRAATLMAKKVVEWWHGERLRELRKRKGWSQAYIAKQFGISVPAVSQWERNEDAPNRERIAALCQMFSASADYFFGFVEEPFEHSEIEKLPPEDRHVLDLFHSGRLHAVLGQVYLDQLEISKDQPRLIEDKTGRKPGQDKAPNR